MQSAVERERARYERLKSERRCPKCTKPADGGRICCWDCVRKVMKARGLRRWALVMGRAA